MPFKPPMPIAPCVLLLVTLAILLGPTAARAQPPEPGPRATSTTTYDFNDDVVRGSFVRPQGEVLVVRKRGDHRSLIRPRQQFIPELLRTVEVL